MTIMLALSHQDVILLLEVQLMLLVLEPSFLHLIHIHTYLDWASCPPTLCGQ